MTYHEKRDTLCITNKRSIIMKRIIETTEGEIVIGELLDLVDFVPTYNVISLDERLRKRLDEKVKRIWKNRA